MQHAGQWCGDGLRAYELRSGRPARGAFKVWRLQICEYTSSHDSHEFQPLRPLPPAPLSVGQPFVAWDPPQLPVRWWLPAVSERTSPPLRCGDSTRELTGRLYGGTNNKLISLAHLVQLVVASDHPAEAPVTLVVPDAPALLSAFDWRSAFKGWACVTDTSLGKRATSSRAITEHAAYFLAQRRVTGVWFTGNVLAHLLLRPWGVSSHPDSHGLRVNGLRSRVEGLEAAFLNFTGGYNAVHFRDLSPLKWKTTLHCQSVSESELWLTNDDLPAYSDAYISAALRQVRASAQA